MTVKTPEQIAAEVAGSYFDTYQDSAEEVGDDEGQPIVETWPALRECIAAAIKADRAQRDAAMADAIRQVRRLMDDDEEPEPTYDERQADYDEYLDQQFWGDH